MFYSYSLSKFVYFTFTRMVVVGKSSFSIILLYKFNLTKNQNCCQSLVNSLSLVFIELKMCQTFVKLFKLLRAFVWLFPGARWSFMIIVTSCCPQVTVGPASIKAVLPQSPLSIQTIIEVVKYVEICVSVNSETERGRMNLNVPV